MGTRLEIFRDGLWRKLKLQNLKDIKYNAVINKIGKLETREISHTNTFSLPYVEQNIKSLDINIFNSKKMAKAMNSKYVAKYYVDNITLQSGFLIINNTLNGKINVNFIDEALEIVELWGTITFRELITSTSLNIPSDYQTVIDGMKFYDMDKTSILGTLPDVGARGNKLALFPNNLNTIGDEFQLNSSDNRVDNAFNPYQSRPLFNFKAFFDLIVETFGYTPIYDASIDWDRLSDTYLVASGMNDNQRDDGGVNNIEYPVFTSDPYYSFFNTFFEEWFHQNTPNYPLSINAIKPDDIDNWSKPSTVQPGYENNRCVFQGNISASLITGSVNMKFTQTNSDGSVTFETVWKHVTPGEDVLFKTLPMTTDNSSGNTIDVTWDKSEYEIPPTNGGEFLGVFVHGIVSFSNDDDYEFQNFEITETYIPEGVISFDSFGQFEANTIDLTFATPNINIKTLLSSIMQKEGMLINVYNKTKEIKFFSYGAYKTQKENGNFNNWSEYLIKGAIPERNTNYGSSYGKINEIGLSSPYAGNTNKIILSNQGVDSKHKDYATNYVSGLRDIGSIFSVPNTTTPYFEYKNTGLGAVEYTGDLGILEQRRANDTSQGSFSGLAALSNVNYLEIPEGIKEWYELVDSSIRVETLFLLPLQVIKNIDLSVPVYIERLGGYYIIEEISEYTNSITPVSVKLIKLEI